MPTAEVKRHWDRVGQLRCLITHRPGPTLHHCSGGSMTAIQGLTGVALKASDWLVIPLAEIMHTGALGIDGSMGVETWEGYYGSQVEHLDEVSRLLKYNVWLKAGINREVTLW